MYIYIYYIIDIHSIYRPRYLSIDLSIYLSTYLSILSIDLSIQAIALPSLCRAHTRCQVLLFQNQSYGLPVLEPINTLLVSLPFMTEKNLYELSLLREPRGEQDPSKIK